MPIPGGRRGGGGGGGGGGVTPVVILGGRGGARDGGGGGDGGGGCGGGGGDGEPGGGEKAGVCSREVVMGCILGREHELSVPVVDCNKRDIYDINCPMAFPAAAVKALCKLRCSVLT